MEKIKMSFFERKKYSLRICLLMFVGLGYPWLAMQLNPPPNPENMQRAHVRILSVSEEHPNIKTEISDGKIQYFEFPPTGYSPFHGFPRASFVVGKFKNKIDNCNGYIDYDEMRFMVSGETFRVWGVHCEGVSVSYADILQMYEKGRGFMRWVEGIGFLLMFSFCGFLVYFEGE